MRKGFFSVLWEGDMKKRAKRVAKAVVGAVRVAKKIAHLRREGVPEKQAQATAINMGKKGRIGIGGEYLPVGKKR
jgi:hypothetical protein